MKDKIKRILIVDDDNTIISILVDKIQLLNHDVEILTANSYEKGIEHINNQKEQIHAAIIDLNLPDAPDGEMVDFTLDKNIPTVVLAEVYDKKLQQKLFDKDILDYIFKDEQKGINNAINSINRILYNYDTTILIVDSSITQRDIIKEILLDMKLDVLTASDGKKAMEIIAKEKNNISLVLADYNMPNMEGAELISEIREQYDKDELAILVLSSSENPDIATNFIKLGSNDFIEKPFTRAEVIVRVNSLLHIMQLFNKTRELSFKDFMTGAYNRRYFYSSGSAIFDKAKREKRDIALVTLDIDNFKNINDNYGHDIGDICIIKLVKLLQNNLRSSDLVARFGGEEFVILLENISKENLKLLFEKIRINVQNNIIETNEYKISFTVSIGISYGMKNNIDDMIKDSDKAVYFCKNNGRNQIKIHH